MYNSIFATIFATIYNIELLFYFIFKIGCQNLEEKTIVPSGP